jgi:hypothetical protein
MILVCLALCAGCAGVYVTEDCKVFGYVLGESALLVECPPEPEVIAEAEEGMPVEKDVAVDGAGISEHLYKLLSGILQAFFKVAP